MTNLFFVNSFGIFLPSLTDSCFVLATLFALLVITVKNPIISVLFLIGLFVTMGGYLIMIGLSFIGLSYLLVYVGAVSILFLFILMLVNVRISELVNETKNSIPLIFLVTLLCGNVSYILLPQENAFIKIFSWEVFNNTFINTSINWDGYLIALPHITNIGNIMYSTYAIWLLLISFILLLAMIGAIVINVKQETIQHNKDLSVHEVPIILQSKFSFLLWKTKLIRLVIIGTSLWCIRYLIINLFDLNISEYISYIGLLVFTGTLEFLADYFIFADSRIFMGPSNVPFSKVSKYDNMNMMNAPRDNIPSSSSQGTGNNRERNEELRRNFLEWRDTWKDKKYLLAKAESIKTTLANLENNLKATDPNDQSKVDSLVKEAKQFTEQLIESTKQDPGYDTQSFESQRTGALYHEKARLNPFDPDHAERAGQIDREIKELEKILDNRSGGYTKTWNDFQDKINKNLEQIENYCRRG